MAKSYCTHPTATIVATAQYDRADRVKATCPRCRMVWLGMFPYSQSYRGRITIAPFWVYRAHHRKFVEGSRRLQETWRYMVEQRRRRLRARKRSS